MTNTHTDFEKWLASFPEEKLVATLREYTQLAEEYLSRADETRSLIALRRRLASVPESTTDGPKFTPPEDEVSLEELFKTVVIPSRRPSLADAVVQVAVGLGGETDARSILASLEELGWAPRGKTPLNSVHATISRLVKDKRLVRTEKGVRVVPGREER